ncbi:MAG: adenosylcobinamide-GDP ribazoletransferase, partial [Pseudomonadota bacterium]
ALGAPMFSDDVVATQDSIVAVFGTLVLVPAWARWVACFCAHELPSLDDGRGASFAVGLSRRALIIQAGAYAAASLVTAPALIVAPVIAIAFIWYWRGKLGGMSGDVMGATIEISEAILLMAVVIAAGLVS